MRALLFELILRTIGIGFDAIGANLDDISAGARICRYGKCKIWPGHANVFLAVRPFGDGIEGLVAFVYSIAFWCSF